MILQAEDDILAKMSEESMRELVNGVDKDVAKLLKKGASKRPMRNSPRSFAVGKALEDSDQDGSMLVGLGGQDFESDRLSIQLASIEKLHGALRGLNYNEKLRVLRCVAVLNGVDL